MSKYDELARLGTATVYEAAGRHGYVEGPFHRIVPGSRAAGPARTVFCGEGDNLMVHAAMASLQPGDVLVIAMPLPAPVALMGDLLATQAKRHGAAAVLVDGAVRDVDELVELGLPVWARHISIRGATKEVVGALDGALTIGGATIAAGDAVVLDGDGVAVIPAERCDDVLQKSLDREAKERVKRERLQAGELSLDLDGLRARIDVR